MTRLTVATWNTEWRKPNSRDGAILRERLAAHDPDIVVLTETHIDFFDEWDGHVACGPEEYAVPAFRSRRSVLLWSKWPWTDIDLIGSDKIPEGCFVQANNQAPSGFIPVVGLIVPYHMSNVVYGTADRRLWDDHEACLDGLVDVVAQLPDSAMSMGDFNQRIPFVWGRRSLNEKLLATFSSMNIITTGQIASVEAQSIDHIACGRAWTALKVAGLSNLREDGHKISDHFGLIAQIRLGR